MRDVTRLPVSTVQDRMIDFQKYMKAPHEAAQIRPASEWLDQVIERFAGNVAHGGRHLPWGKTHGHIGLRPAEVSIWAGINGHGKSMLVNEIMLGLMAQGERVCIASMEMLPRATLYRLTRQAAGVREVSEQYIREIYAWTDGKLWLYDQQGTVKSDRILAVARYCSEELGITHLVIDSLMKCGIDSDDYNGQKRFVDQICAHARDTGTHVHLVAHSRKGESEQQHMGKMDIKGASEITDQADNVFTVWRNKRKEDERQKHAPDDDVLAGPDAMLSCVKQRHGEWEGKVALWFHPDSLQYVAQEGARPIDFLAMAERAAMQSA
jgi:twinkle protein